MSELVVFKNTLAAHVKQNKIIDDVCKIISEIPELNRMKLDPELTVYVCNILENLIEKSDKKEINKLNLASMILTKACNLEENELDAVIKQIKFLDNNGRIKKASAVKKKVKVLGSGLNEKCFECQEILLGNTDVNYYIIFFHLTTLLQVHTRELQ